MVQCTIDNEVLFLHRKNDKGEQILSAIMCIHVDRLKLTGRKDVIIWILQQIEKAFGQLKIDWHNFTNCGVQHCQNADTYEINRDQIEYIEGISVIVHPELSVKDKEEFCSDAVHQQY